MGVTVRLAILLLAACGSAPAPDLGDASPTQVIPSDHQLLVGDLVEGTLHGGVGDYTRIVISAPAAIDWNIHSHVSGTETAHTETDVTSADYTFAPDVAADWFLTVRNQGSAPVTVHVVLSVYGGMTWSGWN